MKTKGLESDRAKFRPRLSDPEHSNTFLRPIFFTCKMVKISIFLGFYKDNLAHVHKAFSSKEFATQ